MDPCCEGSSNFRGQNTVICTSETTIWAGGASHCLQQEEFPVLGQEALQDIRCSVAEYGTIVMVLLKTEPVLILGAQRSECIQEAWVKPAFEGMLCLIFWYRGSLRGCDRASSPRSVCSRRPSHLFWIWTIQATEPKGQLLKVFANGHTSLHHEQIPCPLPSWIRNPTGSRVSPWAWSQSKTE